MKSLAIFTLTLITFYSCKQTAPLVAEDVGGFGPIKIQKERVYTPSELVIGRRICSALKNKRELFEVVTDMKEKFRVRGELINCTQASPYNTEEFNIAISNVSPTDIEYISEIPRPNYFKDVVTDANGAMKIVCANIASSDNVSNQTLNGSSYNLINFNIEQGYDRFTVIKKNQDGLGNYKIVSAEAVAVVTQANQASAKFFGVEKERIRYTSCPKADVFSSIKQTWISAITSF